MRFPNTEGRREKHSQKASTNSWGIKNYRSLILDKNISDDTYQCMGTYPKEEREKYHTQLCGKYRNSAQR